jgi:hypothetical protein
MPKAVTQNRPDPMNLERHLQETRRDICINCALWIKWYSYRDRKGKTQTIYGCVIGKIPDRGKCDSLQGIPKGRKSSLGRSAYR